MLISHIISLSFYHFSTRFPLTKSFNSYSPQKNPTTWHQGISAQMKKKLHNKIWPKLRDLAMKGKPRPSKLLGASRWSLTMQEWESPEFSRKKQTHLTCILAKFDQTDGKSRNACVAASNKDSTRRRWNPSQGCQKHMKWCLSLTQTYLGLITKFKTKKSSSSRSPLMKDWKTWHSFQIIPFPLIIGSGRLAKFKWWLRMQEADDPIAIRSTSAHPPTSKIAIWNAQFAHHDQHQAVCDLGPFDVFFGGFLGRSFLLKIKLCKFVFFACFLQHHEKWAARKAILDNLQLIFGQGLQVWNREENSHQWPPSKRL